MENTLEKSNFSLIPQDLINYVTNLTGFKDGPAHFLILLVIAIFIIFIGFFFANHIKNKSNFFNRVSKTEIVADLVAQTVSIIIKICVIVVALQILGAGSLVGAVLGTAGVIGLGISFAFKDIVENYIAGIILSIRQPFFKGDLVKIEGVEGVIQRMTTRMTMIKSLDGNNVSIPNAKVFKANIINYSTNPFRRFEFSVGIMADGDPNYARTIGLEAMISMDTVLDEPSPTAVTDSLGDSSIKLIFYGWVNQKHNDYYQVRSLAMSEVKDAIEKAGIDIPDPSYIVKLKNITDEPKKVITEKKSNMQDLISPKNIQENVVKEQIEQDESHETLLKNVLKE